MLASPDDGRRTRDHEGRFPSSVPFSGRLLSADFLITLGFLALFTWAIVQARGWPFRASLFPVVAASIVLALVVVKLTLDLLGRQTRRSAPVDERIVGEEEAAQAELEDVFATAPRAVWLPALGWMALFFVMLWALGALIAVPLFAAAYLLLVSRDPPMLAGIYAAAAWAVVYGLFDRLLHIPLPTGTLFGMLGS
jgi:Tripartite tricarboxylate transporter TctB family